MIPIPIILFAYNRPGHLRQTLDCLRENQVPGIYAFSDGPRTPENAPDVAQVRDVLRAIDWCEVILCERETNLGLGRSILTGVTEVLGKHEAAIIFEDDLICVPGTYAYLCAALNQYQNDDRVMSVTGWTHPLVTPSDVTDKPYFDGRAECLVWGTWAKTWQGMEIDAKTLMEQCKDQGIDIYRYGADLVNMANAELRQNIWAVRLLYLHILKKGLCLRPPWSMVEHIGFDANATNAINESWLKNPPLKPSPPIPTRWPETLENAECARLHQKMCGAPPTIPSRSYCFYSFARRVASKALRSVLLGWGLRLKDMIRLVTPPIFIHLAKRLRGNGPTVDYGLSGDYSSWDEALAASIGYDSESILEKTRISLLKVKNGEAVYERDSVLFDEIEYAWPVLSGLMWVAARSRGKLNVMDLGGSLGSTYFQNRIFLSVLPELRWNIVEQSGHVGIGKAYFENDYLRFYAGIGECLADTQPNVVLLSSVLQYLERPYTVFDQILELSCDHVIIDRTPFWAGPTDRLCVQTVPSSIYPASYPSWIFSRQRFYEHLYPDWEDMVTFDNPDRMAGPVDFFYQGMIIVRNNHIS